MKKPNCSSCREENRAMFREDTFGPCELYVPQKSNAKADGPFGGGGARAASAELGTRDIPRMPCTEYKGTAPVVAGRPRPWKNRYRTEYSVLARGNSTTKSAARQAGI